jgi:hypothetical protein
MSICDFIKKRFLGKEICITLLDGEAETLNYNQSVSSNREFFRGVIEEVEDEIIVLNVEKQGKIYISAHFIRCFWEPGFEYYKAISTSITRKIKV